MAIASSASSISKSDLRWRVTEIAQCPICLEDFRNPKSLPCVHSFCLHCLQNICKNKLPRSTVPCPVCRKDFEIPAKGLDDLPHNFFVQKLIDAKDTPSEQPGDALCESCVEDDEDSQGDIPRATVYCVDCNQKLCARCSRPHKMMRSGAHEVKELGADVTVELLQRRRSYCDQHPDRLLELRCFTCKKNVCDICIEFHAQPQYGCNERKNIATHFQSSVGSDFQAILTRVGEFHTDIKQTDDEDKRFTSTVNELETSIKRRGEDAKRIIDGQIDTQVNELLTDLQAVKLTNRIAVAARKDKLELGLTAMESFSSYLMELKSKGSPCDITRAANDLHSRAEELLQTYVRCGDYSAPGIKFVPVNLDVLKSRGQSFIGSFLPPKPTRPATTVPAGRVFGTTADPPAFSQRSAGRLGMNQPRLAKPGLGQPSVGQSGLHQSASGQTGLRQPALCQPGLGQFAVGRQSPSGHPGVGQSGLDQRTLGQPLLGQSPSGQPGIGQPASDQSRLDQPCRDETGLGQVVFGQPGVNQSGLRQPVLDQQDTRHSVLGQPALGQFRFSPYRFDQPSMSQPRLSQSTLVPPVLSQPTLQQPGVSQPDLGQPALYQASSGQSCTHESGLGPAVLGQPAIDQSDVDQTASGQPAVSQPSVGQSDLDQSVLGQQGMGHSGLDQPPLARSSSGQAATGESDLGQPATGQLGMGQSVFSQPALRQSRVGQPGTSQTQPGVGLSTPSNSALDQSSSVQSSTDEIGSGQVVLGQPSVDQSGLRQPVLCPQGMGHSSLGQPASCQAGGEIPFAFSAPTAFSLGKNPQRDRPLRRFPPRR